MSFFNPEIPIKEKVVSRHPWERYIKDAYASTYKYGHNSAKNPIYPPPKRGKIADPQRAKFTVIGNRITKEFIYCVHLVQGLHKYRWQQIDAPVIRGVTDVEWPKAWNNIKIKYGGLAYCLQSQVIVLLNDNFLGGEKELKKLVEEKYLYHITPNYYTEAIKQITDYIKSCGKPCAYLQIAADQEVLGTLIFKLYSDIVPQTCENFLRLCKTNKGGYAGTPIHRIVKDGWIQCGGFGLKDSGLNCENFIVPHDRRGVIGMANDGRDVDCSTQFFILLQPADWMAHKYVAFGQLIEGERTLQKIEAIPTLNESPTKKITIFGAGILNLECQDHKVNKGTHKYIEGHIENLFTIGELFYEALLEKVFLQVEIRTMQRLQEELGEEVVEYTPEDAAKNFDAIQRLMRKKEEMDKQIEKSLTDRSGSPGTTKGENNDFDVEEYEYLLEEYSYNHVSVNAPESIPVKPEKPFYLPLTDVPYPGEVDSTFDLKRLLQGDYCLESDLDKDIPKKKVKNRKMVIPSQLFDMLYKSPTIGSSQDSLDSEDENEIRRYLKDVADHVSFAGDVVRTIAKSGKYNLFQNQGGANLITDEIMRKYRVAEVEYRTHEKAVSICVPQGPNIPKEIRRRQTGFVRKEDFAVLRRFSVPESNGDLIDSEDDDDELDEYEPYTRQVSIRGEYTSVEPQDSNQGEKIVKRRRPTGYIRHIKTDSELIMDETNEDDEDKRSTHVRISASVEEKPDGGRIQRKSNEDDVEPERQGRPSVLLRLYSDVDVSNPEGYAPTLKDYKPIAEQQQAMRSLFLTHSRAYHIFQSDDDPREKFKRRSLLIDGPQQSMDRVLFLQHGPNVYRKISSDYVRTIDQIEHRPANSIRSLEYAKKRPVISVYEYQKKNQEYHNLKHTSNLSHKISRGLRLPGDTPLYNSPTNTSGNTTTYSDLNTFHTI